MRVLFATWAWPTHYYPAVPLLWALRTAGNDVRVVTAPALVDTVTRSGLTAVAAGTDVDFAELMRRPGRPGGPGRGIMAFAAVAEAMAGDVVAFARAWHPHLVLYEPTTFVGPLAARVLGVPAIRCLWTVDFTRSIEEFEEEALGPLARRFGVDRVRALGDLSVDPCPPELQIPGEPPVPVHRIRYVPYNGPALLPGWLTEPPSARRVCVTWGTSLAGMGFDQGAPYAEVLRAFDGLDVEVVATLVAAQRENLGPVPGNVRLVDPVALHLLLPSCAAIVHQGGGGTMMTALVHGVPQLTVPSIPDQMMNSERLAATGAGRLVPAGSARLDVLRKEIEAVLTERAVADAASRMAARMAELPTAHQVATALEEFA